VYLVGSMLATPLGESTFDIDVRVVVGEDDLVRLYGRYGADVDPQMRRAKMRYDRLKQSRRLSRVFRRNIDFQTMTEADAVRHKDKPRVRLDTTPDHHFTAGQGDT
jgi:hypothetical protein